MAAPGNPGATARKHLRVLLPFTCDSLRIPDELAEEIGAAEAHVVVPFGNGKVRRVEVGRDGDGAFLGRGWPELAAACGVGTGWLLVLRHHGGGVLTVKAFDESCCLRELPAGTPAVEAGVSSSDTPRKPQFICVLPPDSMEKMQIPAMFVQSYIPKDHLNSQMAIVLGPLAKIGQIEVEINQTDMLFAGGWSQFLELHGITDVNCLRLRYEGNMVFTVKVFEPNGCQRELKRKDIIIEQNMTSPVAEQKHETPSSSTPRCKSKNNSVGNEGRMKATICKLGSPPIARNSFYSIGPQSWIKKQIGPSTLQKLLALSKPFCDAIGLKESCTITLKTSTDINTSWKVRGSPRGTSYLLIGGWKRFCRDNSLKVGDMCTFNIVSSTLWKVVIERNDEKQDIPSACSTKSTRKNDRTSCREQIEPEDSMVSLTKSLSTTKCLYQTKSPAWLKKEINASTIENQLSLPRNFCEAIGIREPCLVTLKTSTCNTNAWQARVVLYQHCAHMCRLGWKMFCQENDIKVGDICTFNVVEAMVWHVDISRR